MNNDTLQIIEMLNDNFNPQLVRRADMVRTAEMLKLPEKAMYPITQKATKISRALYDISNLLSNAVEPAVEPESEVKPEKVALLKQIDRSVTSITTTELHLLERDPTYVSWGSASKVSKIIKSRQFFPVFITGLSGNGKTMMVEQICATSKIPCIRIQITPETDEDDLIGGFRLINGETVFAKGPVLKAMEMGAVLLIDEIDRATNKIMCLQGILEGKPVIIKKTGEEIRPAAGFNVIATGNTKGKGCEDGRFSASSIIDEAFLERFIVTIEQPYPNKVTEAKILRLHAKKFNIVDPTDFIDRLTSWSDIIRKTFYDDGVDEVISTRRLCYILQTHGLLGGDESVAIDMCISRFDEDTRTAFQGLYGKLSPSDTTGESIDGLEEAQA